MTTLDQGHLHPKLEVPGRTDMSRPGIEPGSLENIIFSYLGDHELQEHIVEDPGDFVAVVLPAFGRLGRNDRQDRRSTHGTIT